MFFSSLVATLNILFWIFNWFRKHRSFRLFIFDSLLFCSSFRLCTCSDTWPVGYVSYWIRYLCLGQNQNICRLQQFWPQNINSDVCFAPFKHQRRPILVGSDLLLPVKLNTISVRNNFARYRFCYRNFMAILLSFFQEFSRIKQFNAEFLLYYLPNALLHAY